MAYRFQTYAELGEAVKKVKPEYADRNSESLGLEFSDKYGDKYRVRVDEEEDRATFAYDPEEGFNILKTLGNLPSSAGAIAEDVATAVMNPLDTAEALGRGVAGAAELALGTDVSPENKRVAEQLGQGLAASAGFDKVGDEYEFTGRGIQERPLDILGMLAGGASVGAKGAALGAKAVGAGRVAGAAERVGAAAQAFDPAVALPRAAVGVTKGAVKGTGRAVAKGTKYVGNRFIAEPLRTRFEGSKAEAALDDINSAIGGAEEFAPNLMDRLQGAVRSVGQTIGSKKDSALEMLERAEAGATEKLDKASMGTTGPIKATGIFESLLTAWLGFTTGLGQRVIQKIIDFSRLEDQTQRKAMLDAASGKFEGEKKYGSVGEAIVDELAIALDTWSKAKKEATRKTRSALKMDAIEVNTDDLKRAVINDEDFNNNFGIRSIIAGEEKPVEVVRPEQVAKTQTFPGPGGNRYTKDQLDQMLRDGVITQAGYNAAFSRTGLEPLGTAKDLGPDAGVTAPASDRAAPDRTIDLRQRPFEGQGGGAAYRPYREGLRDFVEYDTVDMDGNPIKAKAFYRVEDLRNVDVNLSDSDILNLGEDVSAVSQAFDRVFKLPQNATVSDLDKAKRAIANAQRASDGSAYAALTKLRKMVADRIEERYRDPEVLSELGIPEGSPGRANPYVEAMAQYEQYEQTMDSIAKTLKVADPQKKFAGTPLEVVRQSGNPQEVLKAVLNMFGENEKELGMQNLLRLAEETDNNLLLPRIVGYAMSPTFGEGLVVRSEISQLGRAALGFNLVGGLLTPIALAQFSPRFGGMAISYLYSPEGRNLIASVPRRSAQALGRAGQIANVQAGQLRERLSTRFKGFRKVVSEYTGKPENKITPADEQRTLTALQRLQEVVGETMTREQQSTLQTLLQGGTLTQRAQEQGEQAQQRNNILSRLGRTQGEQ